jgi:CheY-like chemotaxis protein
VIRARSGKEALLVAEQCDAPIHLLLTDVVMPRMDGYDLYQRLKLRIPRLQSLFISGYVFDPELSEKLSGEPTLQKPFSAVELSSAVRRALGGSPHGTGGGRESGQSLR